MIDELQQLASEVIEDGIDRIALAKTWRSSIAFCCRRSR